MQLKNKILSAILFLALVSCSKNIKPNDIDFNVTTINTALQPTNNFNVGDTVSFKFAGNPDRITFYSGELGNRFSYKDRTTDSSTNTTFNFASAINTAGTSGSMKLLISTDFVGYKQQNALDSVAAASATWVDISSRANFATNATAISSGTISLADYAAQKTPVYLAFRYDASIATTQAKWTLSGMGLRHYTADTSYVLDSTNFAVPTTFPSWTVSQGWGTIIKDNPFVKFALYSGITATTATASVPATSSFVITGSTSTATAVATQSWLVTGPLDLLKVLPDAGLAIKDKSENTMSISKGLYSSLNANYTYKFVRAGTYNVVFYASSDTKDGQQTIVRTINIVVN